MSKRSVSKDDSYDEDSQKKPVFILDDRTVSSVGRVRTNIRADDTYDIIKGFFPSGLKQTFAGPLIISMREENWNYIVDGPKSDEKLDEVELNKVVPYYQ